MTGPLSHTTAHHFLWPAILFCLEVGTHILHTHPALQTFSLNLPQQELSHKGKICFANTAVMRLAVERPSYKQAGLGCLEKLCR